MLCSIAETLGGASLHPALEFVITWAVLTILGALSIGVLSGSAFWYYYARPTFALWQYKMNPEFPHPRKVASEMSATLRGLVSATLCPATAIFLSQASRSGSTLLSAHAYCGVEPHYGLSGPAYLAAQFVVFWILSDFFEWGNHQIGHRFSWSWAMHRHHHVFANPSPWAVIADEPADQVIRTLPLLLLPLLFPTNIDLLFVQFAAFFYAYGVYLHFGFESAWISAHNTIINGSYEHYYHHAYSGGSTPLHTGFFFKLWDQIVGTTAKGPCKCSRCEVARGARSMEAWKQVKHHDYSVLLSPSWWLSPEAAPAGLASHKVAPPALAKTASPARSRSRGRRK